MRRAIYGTLSALPSKVFSGGLGFAGICATAWPDKFRAWVSDMMTADQIQFYGAAAIIVVAIYWILLLALKPPPEPNLAGPSQSGSGNQLTGFSASPVHIGDVHNHGSSPPPEPVRPPFPSKGYTVVLFVRLEDQQVQRRRYLFNAWEGDAEIALFLSSSDVFTLSVTDVKGEEYSLQVPSGRRGVPIAQIVMLAAQVGFARDDTYFRLSVNMEEVAYRQLGFPIRLPDAKFENMTLFADRNGKQNGAARLYAMLFSDDAKTENDLTEAWEHYSKKLQIFG